MRQEQKIVMQDYKTLTGFGLPKLFYRYVRSADKGHYHLLKQFIKNARTQGAGSPIPFERIFMATKLSFITDRLARKGGGFELFEHCKTCEYK